MHRLLRLAGLHGARHHLFAVVAGVRHHRGAETARRVRQQPRHQRVGAATQQRAETCAAVQVEQHQFAAVGRQVGVQRIDDGAGADGGVHHRLEGEHRRQFRQAPVGGMAGDLRLQSACHQRRLPRAIDREAVVLEGVELGHDAQPGRFVEGREESRPAEDAGKARHAGDADHRRKEHDAVRTRQRLVIERIERVLHGQRAAVGKADDMQWRGRG